MDQDTSETPKTIVDYEERIVTFVDILGFKALVSKGKEEAIEVISNLDKAIQAGFYALEMEEGADWYSVRLFSDCFSISCERDHIGYLLSGLARMQLDLAFNGIFIRGGMATGLHFENERIIFSEGLVRAYDLQYTNTYPRIIIPNHLVAGINNGVNDSLINGANRDWVMQGPDGFYFVDYLKDIEETGAYTGDGDEMFVGHKDAILDQVRMNTQEYHILEKYLWLAAYHNHKFREYYERDDWEDSYYAELESKIIITDNVFPQFGKPVW
jgi:hypothetical protein